MHVTVATYLALEGKSQEKTFCLSVNFLFVCIGAYYCSDQGYKRSLLRPIKGYLLSAIVIIHAYFSNTFLLLHHLVLFGKYRKSFLKRVRNVYISKLAAVIKFVFYFFKNIQWKYKLVLNSYITKQKIVAARAFSFIITTILCWYHITCT